MAGNDVKYPLAGFYFSVSIDLFPENSLDTRFQSVSGLNVDIATETMAEGGENRFRHQFPSVPQFPNILLKRGMAQDTSLITWCKDAIENFVFQPRDLLIKLLNENGEPLAGWQVVNAYPVKWSVSDFNAEESALVIETIELAYQYHRKLNI
jgi:phage tail-like protein